jgi:hypothetical protein
LIIDQSNRSFTRTLFVQRWKDNEVDGNFDTDEK